MHRFNKKQQTSQRNFNSCPEHLQKYTLPKGETAYFDFTLLNDNNELTVFILNTTSSLLTIQKLLIEDDKDIGNNSIMMNYGRGRYSSSRTQDREIREMSFHFCKGTFDITDVSSENGSLFDIDSKALLFFLTEISNVG